MAGYIIQKLAGHRSGVIDVGFVGGLISSTATTFSSSRLSSQNISSAIFHALVILTAWLVVYFRVFFEIFFVDSTIPVLIPLSMMASLTVALIIFTWKKHLPYDGEMNLKNDPVDLKTAVSFACFYTLLVSVFSYLRDELSSTALYMITFFAGILDIDAITLTTARLVNRQILDQEQAVSYVFIALIANTFFKGLLCFFIGKKPLFNIILFPWVATLILQIVIVGWYW